VDQEDYIPGNLLPDFVSGVVFSDLHFQSYAARFERTAVGNRVTIPINPIGWEMQLVKH